MEAGHCGIVVTEQILRAATTYKQIQINIDVIILKSVRDGAEMKWRMCLSWKRVVVLDNKPLLPTQVGNVIQWSLTSLNRSSKYPLTNFRQI